MNILLNFFPVQSGGGQQVASNFLKIIGSNDFAHNWYVFVGQNSELHKLSIEQLAVDHILSYPYSYKARFKTIGLLNNFVKENDIDIIYNYAPVLSLNNIPQVVRTVYSNLYFPEIQFWKSNPLMTRIKKKIIDHFRLKGTLKADGLIFENESMLERAVSLFDYPRDKTVYISPSVSVFEDKEINPIYKNIEKIKSFKILYLSSWHLNKNIHILPKVAKLFRNRNIQVKFILSLNEKDENVKKHLLSQIELFNVSEYFELIGKVEARFVHQVVNSCDAMILLSKLECFSSNVIEAFYFQKPIIISDEEWAKAACQDAGTYVGRSDTNDIAKSIIDLLNNPELYKDKINKGKIRLESFNTPEQKVIEQVKFLEHIYNKYYERN